MLLKPLICYVTGVVTTALAVSAGSGHWGVGCFFAGIVTTLVLQGWLFADAQRAQGACKFILRVVGAPETSPARPTPTGGLRRQIQRRDHPVSPAPKLRPTESPVYRTVFQALRGLGCEPANAKAVAQKAMAELPANAPDDDVIRFALHLATRG